MATKLNWERLIGTGAIAVAIAVFAAFLASYSPPEWHGSNPIRSFFMVVSLPGLMLGLILSRTNSPGSFDQMAVGNAIVALVLVSAFQVRGRLRWVVLGVLVLVGILLAGVAVFSLLFSSIGG